MVCACGTIGWFGAERDRAAEGNVHYDAGRYEEAESAYGEGLIDHPESYRLRFNLGAAQYREGKFADAIATLEQLLPDTNRLMDGASEDVTGLGGSAAYNIGNARFRLGQQAEAQDPQQALALYEQALASYKQAMGFAPDDEAPKFNHEFVERHALALKERLEQERQEQQDQQEQQEQQEQDQQQEQQPQQEDSSQDQQDGGQNQEQGQGDDGQKPPSEDQQAADAQAAEGEGEEQPAPPPHGTSPEGEGAEPEEQHAAAPGGGALGDDSPTDQMSTSEARALIDTARGEEVDPSELRPLTAPAGIGEPREDW